MKKRRILRFAALLCAMLLLIPALFACESKADPLATTAFSRLEITKDKTIRAEVTLSSKDAEAHKGEKAYLYELLPGETAGDLAKKDPIATAPISHKMSFDVDLTIENGTRLYSSFAIYYQNGTPIVPTPRMLDNPTVLADTSVPYLWEEDPKGLQISDAESASALGAFHAMCEIRLASLLSEGNLPFSFCGEEYLLSSVTLASLDEQIKKAYQAGMQVSLRIIADGSTTTALSRAALLDFLAARYTNEENGTVTAFYIDASALSVAEIAAFASAAHKALLSHVPTGRIYVLSPDNSLPGTKTFFEDFSARFSAMTPAAWGAALTLSPIKDVRTTEDSALSLSPNDLKEMCAGLRKLNGAPAYFALCDLLIDATDSTLQAASYAYVYAKASDAGIDSIFYGSQKGDAYGLTDRMGKKREIAEAFRTVDTGLSLDQLHAFRLLSEEIYTTLDEMEPKRRVINGSANTGSGSGQSEYLFNFTTGECYGFFPVGSQPLPKGQANPVSHQSGAHNDPVLFTFLRHGMPQTGIRKLFPDGESLREATAISLHALANYTDPDAESCTATLILQGLDRDGEILQFTANTQASTRSWQNFNFNIASFVSAADLSKPILMTLLVDTETDADEETRDFGLWVKCIRVHRPQSDYALYFIILAIVVGIALSCLLILFFYRRSRKKPRRRRVKQHGGFFDLNGGA